LSFQVCDHETRNIDNRIERHIFLFKKLHMRFVNIFCDKVKLNDLLAKMNVAKKFSGLKPRKCILSLLKDKKSLG